MAIVDVKNGAFAVQAFRKLGRPIKLGEFWCGYSRLGDADPYAGVYQRRHGKRGLIIVKTKYVVPRNPRTVPQQAQRLKIKNAVLGWQALTDMQKQEYNALAAGNGTTGYILFLRVYMRSH